MTAILALLGRLFARPRRRDGAPPFLRIMPIVLLLWPVTSCGAQPVATNAYYVSPSGSDSNAGTEVAPWKTLGYALTKLNAGDTLYLRGGTYFESERTTSRSGTASAPIVIQSYPGERAVIDGSLPDFQAAPNDAWELVNSTLQLYRSKRTFSGSRIRAWLTNDNLQLIEYSSAQNLESTNYGQVNGTAPLYIGPGVQLRPDGHVYIRLQPNPTDLVNASGQQITAVPADPNPGNNKIALFTSKYIVELDGASYIQFRDVTLSYSQSIIDAKNGAHHIGFTGCTFDFGTYGFVLRDNIHDWNIASSGFNNGLPGFVYWTDVKNGDKESAEAYPEFQSAAIIGAIHGFTISKNTFHDTFDALDIDTGSTDSQITGNVFQTIRDDAIELSKTVSNIEVNKNLLWTVGSGISIDGAKGQAGQVYIHHNVIDNSAYQHGGRPGNYREDDWPVWQVIDPFGSHNASDGDAWWKVYNNTIVTRRSGYDWNPSGPSAVGGNSEKYVYNNIFYVLDDRVVFRDELVSKGTHYDGNMYYRLKPGKYPLFVNFADGKDYQSLADFLSKSKTNWERTSLEADPGLSASALAAGFTGVTSMWERYRPANRLAYTPGASYDGLNWPGTAGVTYRGAVPPNESVSDWLLSNFIPFAAVLQTLFQ